MMLNRVDIGIPHVGISEITANQISSEPETRRDINGDADVVIWSMPPK